MYAVFVDIKRGNLLLTIVQAMDKAMEVMKKNKQRAKLNMVAEREAVISSGAEERGLQLFAAVQMNTHFFGTLNSDTNII